MSRVLEHPTPPRLPALFLDGVIILPALQLSIPISEDVAQSLVKLVQNSEYPILGVFPLPAAGQLPTQWGCGTFSRYVLFGS